MPQRVHRREAPALWRGGKRQPCGLLREAQSAPERGSETMSTTEREVRMIEQPGLLGQRPKATRRREQIQGPGTASARNADICEGSETMSTTEREVRMIEQPGGMRINTFGGCDKWKSPVLTRIWKP